MINSKAAAEVEAYNRARKMDLETIQRQDAEIDDIRAENGILKKRVREVELDNEELRDDNTKLRRRVTALERKLENPNEE
jgi:FtsZ-binding cell division protein ZapB